MTAVAGGKPGAGDARRRHPTARPVRQAARGKRVAWLQTETTALFWSLALTALSLSLLGLVMVLSATSSDAVGGGSPWSTFIDQGIWLLVGLVAALAVSLVDHRVWLPVLSRSIIIGSLILLALVKVPGVGLSLNGSSRWIAVGGFTFQPSEFAKLALIVWAADMLTRKHRQVTDLHATVIPILIATASVSGLLLIEPDLGTAILGAGIVLVMMFVAGAAPRHMAAILGVVMSIGLGLAFAAPYRRRRLLAFRNPWEDPLNEGWQAVQSGVSMANGGIRGVGLGASRGKWGFLPEAESDFIYAVIGEELGFIGALTVLLAFVLVGVLGFGLAHRVRESNPLGALLAIGITVWIVGQAFLNIGVVVRALPITGVTLPFLSAGGSSLVVMAVAFGVLLNIARTAK